jgi:pyruvate formate lyase activating enzyme
MDPTGMVFRIQKFALHDGPGIRTTIFLKGCPLRCVWCHNPEGQESGEQVMQPLSGSSAGPQKVGRRFQAEALLDEIEKDRLFYDESGGGVTFSGGEPLQQEVFLTAMLRACRQRELHTVVDTSGHGPPSVMEKVAPLADLFLYDLKLMNEGAHRRFTGISNRPVLENLLLLNRLGRPFRIRIPMVPGITDGESNLRRIADFLEPLDAQQGVDLLPYHRIGQGKYRRLGMQLPAEMPVNRQEIDMDAAAAMFASRGFRVHIGG